MATQKIKGAAFGPPETVADRMTPAHLLEVTMDVDEAIITLEKLRKRIEILNKEIPYRRWKDSEKAMTMANYSREIQALTLALLMLRDHPVS